MAAMHGRRGAGVSGLLQRAAAAAVLAAPLLAAPWAQASLTVTVAQRQIRTFAEGSAPELVFITTLSGAINESLQSEQILDTGDGAQSKAFQFSDITPTAFVGTGGSEAQMRNGSFADANSFDTIFFTLTSSFNFIGSATLSAGGDIRSLAGLRIEQLGPDSEVLVEGSESSGSFDFAGTLEPGDYELSAFALSTGPLKFDPLSIGGFAQFAFTIIFLPPDVEPPGVSVPSRWQRAWCCSACWALAPCGGGLAQRPLVAASPHAEAQHDRGRQLGAAGDGPDVGGSNGGQGNSLPLSSVLSHPVFGKYDGGNMVTLEPDIADLQACSPIAPCCHQEAR